MYLNNVHISKSANTHLKTFSALKHQRHSSPSFTKADYFLLCAAAESFEDRHYATLQFGESLRPPPRRERQLSALKKKGASESSPPSFAKPGPFQASSRKPSLARRGGRSGWNRASLRSAPAAQACSCNTFIQIRRNETFTVTELTGASCFCPSARERRATGVGADGLCLCRWCSGQWAFLLVLISGPRVHMTYCSLAMLSNKCGHLLQQYLH